MVTGGGRGNVIGGSDSRSKVKVKGQTLKKDEKHPFQPRSRSEGQFHFG